MHRLPVLALLLFAFALFIVAAAPKCAVQEWAQTFDGGVIQHRIDASGNVYSLRFAPPPPFGAFELTKFDTTGRLLWTSPPLVGDYGTRFSGDATFDVDAVGNAYVTIAPPIDALVGDLVTTKLSSAGQLIWTARLATEPGQQFRWPAIAVDRSSGAAYLAAMQMNDSLSTIEYTPEGQEAWMSLYRPGVGVSICDTCSQGPLVVAPGGGVAVNASLPDGTILLDYDPHGTLTWTRRDSQAVAIDTSGSVYAIGYGEVQKLAPSGTLLWAVPFWASELAIDDAGNVYVTGRVSQDDYSKVTTRKYGPSGEQVWSSDYIPPARPEVPAAIAVDEAGGVYVLIDHHGDAYGIGWYESASLKTVKYGGDGRQEWIAVYDKTVASGVTSRDLALDAHAKVYVLAGGVIVIKYAEVEYRRAAGP